MGRGVIGLLHTAEVELRDYRSKFTQHHCVEPSTVQLLKLFAIAKAMQSDDTGLIRKRACDHATQLISR